MKPKSDEPEVAVATKDDAVAEKGAAPSAEPLVSVVTPCHNTDRYLAQALESVLGQSYSNWELIFLNNRSTDRSLEIAREYARTDARIRIHENDEFLSQLENYNRALTLISDESQYVKFVEADNWIHPDCLAEMVAVAASDPRVGIVSAYSMCETHLRLTGLPMDARITDGRTIARMHLLEDAYLFGAPTTVLLRASIVRAKEPFFGASEWLCWDLSAYFEILRNWDFGFVHQVLTFVRTQNEGSIQASRVNMDAMALDRFAALVRHGRQFLDEGELGVEMRRRRRRYYDHLAQAAVEQRGSDYWEFHRRGLADLNLPMSRWAIFARLVARALRLVVNPGLAAAAIWRRFTPQRARSDASPIPASSHEDSEISE